MGALSEATAMTAARFLEWTAASDGRFELEAGAVREMAAEQARHARTKFAAAKALEQGIATAGLDCEVFPDGMLVVIDDTTVRQPDAAVQCAPVADESKVLDTPVIVVEVSSPSSVSRDETYKLVEYFSLPSVMHYLLLSPDRRIVVHFRRTAAGGAIETTILSQGELDLTPPGFRVTVEALLGAVQ
ncbi:Uma2 family endonuclease [Aquibium sp. A9E412]|uniref:Uma2 family endonuclease n=1 Tax=Aquibium sp. A9E412 TaxID=2976767 RepID=UPI0025B118D5|nr:Uma2 family endonuclease [Aquibium sp. A9E412]MDN2567493.1 Uma2 family endonuclease [Aquibium sp. A9E412]